MHLKHVVMLHLITSAGLLAQPKPGVANTSDTSFNAYSMQAQNSKPQPIALYQKALNHLLGKSGAEKSAEKAAVIFKILAEKNWSPAQHMLGNMYYKGKGVEKNDLLAYKWLSLAAKNNTQLAKSIYKKHRFLHDKLKQSLSARSFYKLEVWIAEWKPSGI